MSRTLPDEIYLGVGAYHHIQPVSRQYGGALYVRADRPDIVAALALIEAVRPAITAATHPAQAPVEEE